MGAGDETRTWKHVQSIQDDTILYSQKPRLNWPYRYKPVEERTPMDYYNLFMGRSILQNMVDGMNEHYIDEWTSPSSSSSSPPAVDDTDSFHYFTEGSIRRHNGIDLARNIDRIHRTMSVDAKPLFNRGTLEADSTLLSTNMKYFIITFVSVRKRTCSQRKRKMCFILSAL